MAWVEKRLSGYLVRWRDGQGRKQQRLFREESTALVFAGSKERERERPKAPGGACVAEYMETSLRAAEDLRESTRYHYVSMASKHIAPAIGARLLAQVTTDDVRELLARMREAGYSGSYRAIARNVLTRTFTLAVSEGLLFRSPLDAVPVLKQERRPEVQPLDVQEVEALASAILPRYRAAVLVMAYAGLRVGEVGALTISNVNLLKREVRVVAGVARAGGRLIVAAPKTPAGRRIVPLPQFLAQEMREHVERFGLAPDGRVFHTPAVNQHADEFGLLHAASLHKPFKRARTRVGLPHVHPHTLRHTYAALLIREGAHPKVIQTLMGHASIRVTMDLYGHLLPGLGAQFAQRLDETRRAAWAGWGGGRGPRV
jgi:integrase